jgi:hypothetical protein
MITGRIDILRKLLTLSQIQLRLVLEEKWKDWETIAHEKKGLYKQLMASKGPLIHPAEEEIVGAIREAEKRTLKELSDRRNETKKELAEIDRFTGGIKNYRQSYPKSSKRHLNIKI